MSSQAKMFRHLCRELGLIYNDNKKSWESKSTENQNLTMGIIFTKITCVVSGKEEYQDFHLFDGDHKLKPWWYLDDLKCMKSQSKATRMIFRNVYVQTYHRPNNDFSLTITFCKDKTNKDDDCIKFLIIFGKHYKMANVKEGFSQSEMNRAIQTTKRLVKFHTGVRRVLQG